MTEAIDVGRTAPIFYVLVQPEGKTEADRVDTTDLVTSFSFEDSEKKSDLLKLTVDNWDLSAFDKAIWRPGNTLIVSWGYQGQMAPMRSCIIQKVKGSTVLSIEAQSKAVLMNKVTKSKTYENTRRSEIVHAIAKDYGYDEAHRFIEETDQTYEHIVQARATDAQFLKSMADREHFEFYVDFEGLHWHPRRLGQRPLRILQYYLPPDVGDILTFDVENDIFAKPAKVVAKGRDPVKKTDVSGEGSNSATDRDALNPIAEIVDPATGLSTLRLNASSSETKPTTETNAKQVKKEADGAFKRTVLAAVKLTAEMVGDPGICAKSVLDVRGISKRLSGLYYVNEAFHTIDSSGYKLKLKLSTDGSSGHSENLLDADATTKPSAGTLAACQADLDARVAVLKAKVPGWAGPGSALPAGADKDPEVARLSQELTVVNSRCQALAAAQSKAKPNENGGKPVDPNAATINEVVDPSTGLSALKYGDSQGRDSAGKK